MSDSSNTKTIKQSFIDITPNMDVSVLNDHQLSSNKWETRSNLQVTLLNRNNNDYASDKGSTKSLFFEQTQQNSFKLKNSLSDKADEYFALSMNLYQKSQYESSITTLTKALNLNAINPIYYLMKSDAFLKIGDLNSSITNFTLQMNFIKSTISDDEQIISTHVNNYSEKLAFLYYLKAQTFYDCKYYLDALDNFNKVAKLKPENLSYLFRSISCLVAMNRIDEALAFVNKIIETNEDNRRAVQLYVLRARLHLKYNNQTLCFYDLRDALTLEPDNKEANQLMTMIEDAGEQLKNDSIILNLNGRINDALNKITGAIAINPSKAEYHLHRGIFYKRLKNYDFAIDEFILGLDKIDHTPHIDPGLFINLQRQILLTYNDFAMQCFDKHHYTETVVLLNKAIKMEKYEKGLYINRGDAFYKQQDYNFALLDYEQALEIDPSDDNISQRIAKVYYHYAINAYNKKDYKVANLNFSHAIQYAPFFCRYYISRSRTFFLLEDMEAAKIDICICVLLDPANHEIPAIISRLFPNVDLNFLMKSNFMKKAYAHLQEHNHSNNLNIFNPNNDDTTIDKISK